MQSFEEIVEICIPHTNIRKLAGRDTGNPVLPPLDLQPTAVGALEAVEPPQYSAADTPEPISAQPPQPAAPTVESAPPPPQQATPTPDLGEAPASPQAGLPAKPEVTAMEETIVAPVEELAISQVAAEQPPAQEVAAAAPPAAQVTPSSFGWDGEGGGAKGREYSSSFACCGCGAVQRGIESMGIVQGYCLSLST